MLDFSRVVCELGFYIWWYFNVHSSPKCLRKYQLVYRVSSESWLFQRVAVDIFSPYRVNIELLINIHISSGST